MDDTPIPTPAATESPSATYRKGQWSVVAKLLVVLQTISIPAIGYLIAEWNGIRADVAALTNRITVAEVRIDTAERGNSEKFAELKSYLQRLDAKLDRLLLEHRP